jgi:ribosomal protein S18 acetylase RimI-like enzyme
VNIRPSRERADDAADTPASLAGRACYRPRVDDATLARLEHENMIEWARVFTAQVPDSLARVDGGIGTFLTGLPASLFNQIVVVDEAATDRALGDAVTTARDRKARFCVVLRHGLDDRFASVVSDLGLVVDGHVLPGMAFHPIPASIARVSDGYDIRVIRDAAGLEDHVRAAAEGFGFPEPFARAVIGEELWARERCTVYVGYEDDAPVSAGFSVRTGRTLGIFTIATIPAARGRGHGSAMTARLVADGFAAGCDVATLQASDEGRPLYERLGFRLVQAYDVYLEPRD